MWGWVAEIIKFGPVLRNPGRADSKIYYIVFKNPKADLPRSPGGFFWSMLQGMRWELRYEFFEYAGLQIGALHQQQQTPGSTQMKTRKRRQEEQEVVEKKGARLRLKINRFMNPSTILRVFNNFFIQEEYFSKDVKKYVPHKPFFEFNRIVKGKIMGDFIKFTVVPVSREFEFNEDYIIQRYLSFGDAKFKALAEALANLRDVKNYIPSLINQFSRPEDLLKRCNSKNPILMICSDPTQQEDLSVTPSCVYVSMAYMMKNGWTNAQQYVLECVKSGHLCLPFLVNNNDCNHYVDRMITKLKSSTNTIKNAIAAKTLRQTESSEKSQTAKAIDNRALLQLSQRYANRNQFIKIEFIQSPFVFCSQITQITAEPIPQFQFKSMFTGQFDQEEYDLLQKLIPVSQNKLKRFQDKVCSYREISKAVMCKEE